MQKYFIGWRQLQNKKKQSLRQWLLKWSAIALFGWVMIFGSATASLLLINDYRAINSYAGEEWAGEADMYCAAPYKQNDKILIKQVINCK